MNNILETLNIKGFDVHILISHDAENPLDWGSATLVTAHRRYTFGGDRLPFDANSIEEAFDWHLDGRGLTRRDVIWLPVYLYDHSGLALSDTPFGDRWDSGQLGYIYETRSNIRAEYRVQRISPKREQVAGGEFEDGSCEAYEMAFSHWGCAEDYILRDGSYYRRDDEDDDTSPASPKLYLTSALDNGAGGH